MEPIKIKVFLLGAYNIEQMTHALGCPINTSGAAVRLSLPHHSISDEEKMRQWTSTDGARWWEREKRHLYIKIRIIKFNEFESICNNMDEDPSEREPVAS